jgi:hypothetical protein
MGWLNDCVTTSVKGASSPRMYIVGTKRKLRGEGEGKAGREFWPAVEGRMGESARRRERPCSVSQGGQDVAVNLKSHPAVGLWAWWAAGLLNLLSRTEKRCFLIVWKPPGKGNERLRY